MNETKLNIKKILTYLVIAVIALQILGLFVTDIVKVNERQVAVITRFGKIVDVKGPGWHFKIPYFDSVAAVYDSAVQSISLDDVTAATKDQQSIKLKLNVQVKIDPSKAKEIFQQVKDQKYLNDTVLLPIIQETIKSKTAKFSAFDLLDKRDLLKSETELGLSEKFKEFNTVVTTVNIVNIDFSDQFDKAIEQKVIAEQLVLQKKQELEKEKLESDIAITKAKAEAESIRIRGDALKASPEALEKAKIEKWDGKLPVVSSGNSILNVDSLINKK
jgi:prohibitin 2